MRALVLLLWLAGVVQVAISAANLFLPGKLKYRENLGHVAPIIRQIFVVHSAYIVGGRPAVRRRHLWVCERVDQRTRFGTLSSRRHGHILAVPGSGPAPLLRCVAASSKSRRRHRFHGGGFVPCRGVRRGGNCAACLGNFFPVARTTRHWENASGNPIDPPTRE
jgi:hypothetical protein